MRSTFTVITFLLVILANMVYANRVHWEHFCASERAACCTRFLGPRGVGPTHSCGQARSYDHYNAEDKVWIHPSNYRAVTFRRCCADAGRFGCSIRWEAPGSSAHRITERNVMTKSSSGTITDAKC